MARILIIDDDPQYSDMLRTFFERDGHSALVAVNGAEGLRAFRAQPFDLVITDIYMPEQDGLETIRDFKREAPQVPIVAISGGGRDGYITPLRYALDFGADQTLAKPFELLDLRRLVTGMLAERGRQ